MVSFLLLAMKKRLPATQEPEKAINEVELPVYHKNFKNVGIHCVHRK